MYSTLPNDATRAHAKAFWASWGPYKALFHIHLGGARCRLESRPTVTRQCRPPRPARAAARGPHSPPTPLGRVLSPGPSGASPWRDRDCLETTPKIGRKSTRSADLDGEARRRRAAARAADSSGTEPASTCRKHGRPSEGGLGGSGKYGYGGWAPGRYTRRHAHARGHAREVGAAANRATARPLKRQAVARSTPAVHPGQERRHGGRRGRERRTGSRSGSEGRRGACSWTKSLQKGNAPLAAAHVDAARPVVSIWAELAGASDGAVGGDARRVRGGCGSDQVQRAGGTRGSTRPMSGDRARCTRRGGAHQGRLVRDSADEDLGPRRRRRSRRSARWR